MTLESRDAGPTRWRPHRSGVTRRRGSRCGSLRPTGASVPHPARGWCL